MPVLLALLLLVCCALPAVAQTDKPKLININQTIDSFISTQSAKRDDIAYERWIFSGRANQLVMIEMSSEQFDPSLRLYAPNNSLLSSDDNGGIGYSARLIIKLPADGNYTIEASAVWRNRNGGYRLNLANTETPIKTGSAKLIADLEYYERCLRITKDASWASELHTGRILPLLLLQRDEDARVAAELAVALARKAEDRFAEERAFTIIGTGYARFEDYERALPYFEQSLLLARELRDRTNEAVILQALADTNQFLDKFEAARKYYQELIELRRKANDRSGEGFALFGLAESYRLSKQPQQALSNYEQALTISRETKNRSGEGYTLFGLADSYRALDQYDRAITFYEQTLAISREIKERALEALALAALADGYRYQGRCERAIPFYEQTLLIRRELQDLRGEAYTLNGLALCERAQNQAPLAVAHYEQMLTICREIKDRRGELIALNALGTAYLEAAQPQQAVTVYEKVLAAQREAKDRKGEYNSLIGIANAHRDLGNYARALPYLEQALAMNKDMPERGNLDQLLANLATNSYFANQYPAALEYGERWRELKQQTKDEAGEANALLLLATTARAINDANRAITAYQQAITLFQKIKNATGEYSSYYGLAEIARQQKDGVKLKFNYEAALNIIEADLKLSATNQPGIVAPDTLYQNYVQALATTQQFPEAFAVAERAAVYRYRQLVLNTGTINSDDQNKLIKRFPAAIVADIKATAQRLNATIVAYFTTKDGLVVWAVKPDGSIFGNYQEIKSTQLAELLDRRHSVLETKSPRSESLRAIFTTETTDNSTATNTTATNNTTTTPTTNIGSNIGSNIDSEVFNLLFPEAIAAVLPTEPESRLIIVAGGKIAAQPFGDLRDREGRQLIDRFVISQLPSISALQATRSTRNSDPASGSLLLGGTVLTSINGKNLPLLEGAKEELKIAADILKVRANTEAAATKALLREQANGKQIIQLSTYAYLDDSNPMNSFIVLSPTLTETGTVVSTGLLTSAELMTSWRLNTDLILLTATQNGFSNSNGTGLQAFTTSLCLAGAPTAITTLWNVDSKITTHFIKQFYERFKRGGDIGVSYHFAVLKTREKYRNPAQWAGFILLGEPAH